MADIAVYRPSTGTWYVRNLLAVQFGDAGDIPVPGDYNGDGITDLAVYRPSTGTWYVRNLLAVQFGDPGDVPVPGDYDGDGTTDLAVFRPSSTMWLVRNQLAVSFGTADDTLVPGDYNGDGATDIAVYRPATGTWLISNQFSLQHGDAGDEPLVRRPGAFLKRYPQLSTHHRPRWTSVCALAIAALAVQVPDASAIDTFEPNNTRHTATPIVSGSPRVSYLSTPGDFDYYRFTVSSPQHVRIDLAVPDAMHCCGGCTTVGDSVFAA